jgi:adenylate cyclase
VSTLRLEIVTGVGKGTTADVGGIAVLGRGDTCSFVIPDPAVSREHAVIRPSEDGQGYVLEDLGSSSGTYVNGTPARRATLQDGDTIRIGSVEMRVRRLGEERLQGEVRPEDVEVVRTRQLPTTRMSLDALKFRLGSMDLLSSGVGQVAEDAPEPAGSATEVSGDVAARLEQLVEISIAMATIHEPQRLMREVASRLCTMFPQIRRLGLFELHDDTGDGDPYLRASYLIDRSQRASGQRVQVSHSVLQAALQERRAILSEDVSMDPRFQLSESLSEAGVCSMICTPLVLGERILGALYVDATDPSNLFDEGALRLVIGVAAILAASIENARLFSRVQAESVQRSNLERYFAPNLVERVIKGEVPLARQGRFASGTILFVDIRGFTRLTELTEPGILVEALNEYFAGMQRIIFRSGGTVERFGGDSILAYWGVVEQDADSAARASRAALNMLSEIFRINPELEAKGRPRLKIAIGVNSGDVVVGDVGSAERYEFTILGTAINLARRLESQAGPWEVIAGATTVRGLGRGALQVPFPPATVKGMDEAVALSALYGLRRPADGSGAIRYDLALQATLDCGQGPEVVLVVALAAQPGRVELEVLTHADPAPGHAARIAFTLPRGKQWFTALGKASEGEGDTAVDDTMILDASTLDLQDLHRLERLSITIDNAEELLAFLGVRL